MAGVLSLDPSWLALRLGFTSLLDFAAVFCDFLGRVYLPGLLFFKQSPNGFERHLSFSGGTCTSDRVEDNLS